MAKTFYTERDIEDLAKRNEFSLEVNDDVVLTELAYEKASRLGVKLVQTHDTPPCAPIRPYIAKGVAKPVPNQKPVQPTASGTSNTEELKRKVKAAVFEKLGSQVDPDLLDRIVDRVLDSIGMS